MGRETITDENLNFVDRLKAHRFVAEGSLKVGEESGDGKLRVTKGEDYYHVHVCGLSVEEGNKFSYSALKLRLGSDAVTPIPLSEHGAQVGFKVWIHQGGKEWMLDYVVDEKNPNEAGLSKVRQVSREGYVWSTKDLGTLEEDRKYWDLFIAIAGVPYVVDIKATLDAINIDGGETEIQRMRESLLKSVE